MKTEKLTDGIDRRTVSLLLLGLLIGSALTAGAEKLSASSGEAAAQELISTLEKSSGQDFELVTLEKQNGLYQAQIKNQQDQLTTYYITEDGSSIIQESGITNLKQFSSRVDAQAEFSNCMAEKDVVMYGNLSQQETVAQVQLLGGANQVSGIYADVNQEENIVEVINRGIQRIPAFVYDNSTLQGVQSVSSLENFTGCEYAAN